MCVGGGVVLKGGEGCVLKGGSCLHVVCVCGREEQEIVCLLVGCLTYKQQARVSQGWRLFVCLLVA